MTNFLHYEIPCLLFLCCVLGRAHAVRFKSHSDARPLAATRAQVWLGRPHFMIFWAFCVDASTPASHRLSSLSLLYLPIHFAIHWFSGREVNFSVGLAQIYCSPILKIAQVHSPPVARGRKAMDARDHVKATPQYRFALPGRLAGSTLQLYLLAGNQVKAKAENK